MKWTDEFAAILDLACDYWHSIEQREQYERLGNLERLKGQFDNEIREARSDEAAKQLAFVKAYKAAQEEPRLTLAS
jgi:hypothetical protein